MRTTIREIAALLRVGHPDRTARTSGGGVGDSLLNQRCALGDSMPGDVDC